MVADPDHSGKESRLHALGAIDGRLLHVTFTLRSDDTLLRVISARDAHRQERQIYLHSTQRFGDCGAKFPILPLPCANNQPYRCR